MKRTLVGILLSLFVQVAIGDDRADIIQCATLRESLKRLDCYDAVARKLSATDGVGTGDKADAAARSALKAVRRFQTRVQTGISRRDYAPALSETKFEVQEFLESAASKQNPELANRFKSVIEGYQLAFDVWDNSLPHLSNPLGDNMGFYTRGRALLGRLTSKYPEIAKKGVANVSSSQAMQIIWATASDEISELSKLLPPQ